MALRSKPATGEVAPALKEQLTLLSFLVLFVGIVSTETYYMGFGIRYQLLDLSLTHLIYRGLTSILVSPWLIVVYLLAIAWLAGGAEWFSGRQSRLALLVQPTSYVLIAALVTVAYFAAVGAGAKAATVDLSASFSNLPVVQEIMDKNGKPLPYHGDRLLFAGKDTLVVFAAAATEAESPFIHLLRRDDLGAITVTR